MQAQLFYTGGYSSGDPYGIKLCSFDPKGEKISILERYEIEDASYLCLSHDKKNLYAVIEKSKYKNREGGGVAAYSINNDGCLTFLNDGHVGSNGPCHISVNENDSMLYTANYGGGSFSFISLEHGGFIGSSRVIDSMIFGQASNAVAERQDKLHPHFITPYLINEKQTLWLCDLGSDLVIVLDQNGNELCKLAVKPGSGPRHLVLHKNGFQQNPYIYLVCELSNDVYRLTLETSESGLCISQSAAFPTMYKSDPQSTCAAIKLSPCGGYLLASNRGGGCDSLSVMRLDENTGLPQLIQVMETGYRCPRDFTFNASGDRVFCANQESDIITVFAWDEKNGCLSEQTAECNVNKPTCIVFL